MLRTTTTIHILKGTDIDMWNSNKKNRRKKKSHLGVLSRTDDTCAEFQSINQFPSFHPLPPSTSPTFNSLDDYPWHSTRTIREWKPMSRIHTSSICDTSFDFRQIHLNRYKHADFHQISISSLWSRISNLRQCANWSASFNYFPVIVISFFVP